MRVQIGQLAVGVIILEDSAGEQLGTRTPNLLQPCGQLAHASPIDEVTVRLSGSQNLELKPRLEARNRDRRDPFLAERPIAIVRIRLEEAVLYHHVAVDPEPSEPSGRPGPPTVVSEANNSLHGICAEHHQDCRVHSLTPFHKGLHLTIA